MTPLLRVLVARDLKARYRGTVLGFLWTFVNPALLVATYTVVFSVFNRSGIRGYPAFVLCGLLPWICFSGSLLSACTAVLEKEDWVKHLAFPTQVLPAAAVFSHFLHLLLSLPCLFVFLALYGLPIGWSALGLVPVLCVQLALALGLAWLLAAAQVAYRDVLYMLSNLMTLWFFLTPVVYPLDRVPPAARGLFLLNPMTGVVKSCQEVLFFGRAPAWGPLAASAGWAVAAVLVGLAVFEWRRPSFAEAI